MRSAIQVSVGGERITGWESVVVTSSLGSVTASLQISGGSSAGLSIDGQARVRVLHGDQAVFRGHFDTLRVAVDREATSFDATARSLVADLVDSQIEPEAAPRPRRNQRLASLVQRYVHALAPRVQLDLSLLGDTADVANFASTPGETYWGAIERILRKAGVLATSGEQGELRLISPSEFPRLPLQLRQGDNVLSMSAATSFKERANYTVARGQGSSKGSNWEAALEVRGSAEDLAVRGSRVSVVQIEGEPTIAECSARAQWEQAIRAARGSRATVLVPGWTYGSEEDLFRPGLLAPVALPAIGVSGRMLVDAVQLRETPEGRTTQLSLVRPDAYRAQPTLAADADPVATSFAGGVA